MLTLKGCPRCGGDLYQECNEFDENEEACLQCGYRRFEGALGLADLSIAASGRQPRVTRIAA